MKRRRIASVDAVPVRMAVAYLSIWSYCSAIFAQLIGRVIAGFSPGHRSASPAAGRYSFTLLMRLIRGSSSNPSSLVLPNPISDWPCVSTYGFHRHFGAVVDGAVDHGVHLGGGAVEP